MGECGLLEEVIVSERIMITCASVALIRIVADGMACWSNNLVSFMAASATGDESSFGEACMETESFEASAEMTLTTAIIKKTDASIPTIRQKMKATLATINREKCGDEIIFCIALQINTNRK